MRRPFLRAARKQVGRAQEAAANHTVDRRAPLMASRAPAPLGHVKRASDARPDRWPARAGRRKANLERFTWRRAERRRKAPLDGKV